MDDKHIPAAVLSPILFFALLFVYTKIAGPLPLSVSSVVTQKTDTFSVTGEGKVTVVPDIATVTVGVETTGNTARQAQNDLNQKITAVSSAIKGLGIDQNDIQTTNYNIYPAYDYSGSRQRITGYQASTNLLIKVRDMDNINAVVDKATEQGANTIGGVTFDISDKSKAEDEARQKAFQEAHTKAQKAAQIAGFRLGRVINYSEGKNTQAYPPLPLLRANAESGKGEGIPTEVEPGSQEIVLNVTISYEIL